MGDSVINIEEYVRRYNNLNRIAIQGINDAWEYLDYYLKKLQSFKKRRTGSNIYSTAFCATLT